MVKKVLYVLICTLLGCVFLLSAITKIQPIEPFEFAVVDTRIISSALAPFIARLIIGFEFVIGTFLILNLNLKRYVYFFSILILCVFSVHLTYQILIVGDSGNCGCFGSYFEMTPQQALLKNVAMLGLLFILRVQHVGWDLKQKFQPIVKYLAFIVLLLPFVLNTVVLDYSSAYNRSTDEYYPLELDSLYKYANPDYNLPPNTLSEGKHVVAFISMGCKHCVVVAKMLRIMYEQNSELPIFFVLNGSTELSTAFYRETRSEIVPSARLGANTFLQLTRGSFPRIYLINNGIVEGELNRMSLNQSEIEKWLER